MKKTILIVDDDSLTRSLLREILEPEGYGVLEAADGHQALQRVAETQVDLLMTDRTMPGLDGLGLLKRLQDQKSKIPAIMISGYGEESLWGEAIGLGARDYIVKPFSADAVIAVVRKSLSGGKK